MNKKNIYYLLVIIFLLSGCATTGKYFEMSKDPDPAVKRFISLHQIQKGLTPAEVKAILGGQVIVGYEMPDIKTKRYKPILVKNPHRTENYTSGRHAHVIEYYFIGINLADDKITDDELAPLVFDQGKLIGWGWDFLKKIKE